MQGSSLSPFLFNIYLDYAIGNNPVLREMANQGKLVAFADDILIVSENSEEAEQDIGRLEQFGLSHGLHINKAKSQVIIGNPRLKELKDIAGIERWEKGDHLGLIIITNRIELIKY